MKITDEVLDKAYEFLKECECFYVLTINGDFPAGRPFGAIMKNGNKLYISTHDGNQAHKQLRNNDHIQILAKKESSREWLRITGLAEECRNINRKEQMLRDCPILQKHFPSAEYAHYLLFQIEVQNVEFYQ